MNTKYTIKFERIYGTVDRLKVVAHIANNKANQETYNFEVLM